MSGTGVEGPWGQLGGCPCGFVPHPVWGRTVLSPKRLEAPHLCIWPPGWERDFSPSPRLATIPWATSAPATVGEYSRERFSVGSVAMVAGRYCGKVEIQAGVTPQTPTCHLCPRAACQLGAGWGPLSRGRCIRTQRDILPSSPQPISVVSHAGVTLGVPDSQPQQQLPPGWGKVHSIPHSQGDRGKL